MIPFAVPSVAMLILKLFTLLGIAVYVVFAAVMVRQEHTMANVLEEGFEPVIRMFTYLHLAFSIGLFILAFIIL